MRKTDSFEKTLMLGKIEGGIPSLKFSYSLLLRNFPGSLVMMLLGSEEAAGYMLQAGCIAEA